jgi:hypothetical protein
MRPHMEKTETNIVRYNIINDSWEPVSQEELRTFPILQARRIIMELFCPKGPIVINPLDESRIRYLAIEESLNIDPSGTLLQDYIVEGAGIDPLWCPAKRASSKPSIDNDLVRARIADDCRSKDWRDPDSQTQKEIGKLRERPGFSSPLSPL